MKLNQYKPAVGKIWLQLAAGIMWFGVGLMLARYAATWLQRENDGIRFYLVLAGLMLVVGVYVFGFSILARRNIRRVEAFGSKKVCFFAFQSWTSYPLVVFMILLGFFLRVYSPLPKAVLAVVYLGIGGGLFLASMHDFKYIRQGLRAEIGKG